MSKESATSPGLIEIGFKPVKYKRRNSDLSVSAKQIVGLSADVLSNFVEALAKELDNKLDVYSPAKTVTEVLTSPELERETSGENKGKPKINAQSGQLTAKPFNIKTQRIINRVLDAIEAKLDPMGTDRKKHKAFKVKLKYDDAIYMAKRMMAHFNEFASIESYVPDAYTMYEDIKNEVTKRKTNGD